MSKKKLTKVALKIIKEKGLINLECEEVCKHARIPKGSFTLVTGCSWTAFFNELKKTVSDTTLHKITKTRLDVDLRKKYILDAAINIAKKIGYQKLTCKNISHETNMSRSHITHRFKSIKILKRLVLRTAIDQKILPIIAQGLANKDEATKKIPQKLKETALKSIL